MAFQHAEIAIESGGLSQIHTQTLGTSDGPLFSTIYHVVEVRWPRFGYGCDCNAFSNESQLPYIFALVKEVLRWRPPTPLGESSCNALPPRPRLIASSRYGDMSEFMQREVHKDAYIRDFHKNLSPSSRAR